jgi:hypothetical protein
MKDPLPQSILFVSLIVLDLIIIAAILIKGHANFAEVYKHLMS